VLLSVGSPADTDLCCTGYHNQMPVNQRDVERIILAVPNFQTQWVAFLEDWKTDPEIPYFVGMSELAHYIVESYARGETGEFSNLFATVEEILRTSTPELENLISVGLFEDIQNIASRREFGATVFEKWLGARSRVVWDEVDAYMRKVALWEEQQKPKWWQFWRTRRAFDAEKALSQVENPELRRIIEANYPKRK
jgi:hypothetical protein